MYTLASLTAAIQAYTENTEATFITYIPDFIRMSEERIIKATQLEVFRKNEKILVSDGDRCVDKPCDWLSTYSLSLMDDDDASTRTALQSKDKTFLDEYWPDYTQTGSPRYYTDHDVETFTLAPTPDHDVMVFVSYLHRPESLVDAESSTETWISTNAPQALLYGSLVEAYSFMKGAQDMLAFYDSRFGESIMRMKNHGEALEPDDAVRRGMIHTERT